jgi:hypothetical protein
MIICVLELLPKEKWFFDNLPLVNPSGERNDRTDKGSVGSQSYCDAEQTATKTHLLRFWLLALQ